MKALLDLVPLLVFFVLAKMKTILIATEGLIIASVIVYSVHFILQKGRLEKQQWITLLLTLAFGGLTVYLKNDMWIRWEAIILDWIIATAFLVSPMVGKTPIPLAQRLLSHVFELSAAGWKKLNLTWVLFFLLIGVYRYIFAIVYPQYFVNSKIIGYVITFSFVIGVFVALRHHIKDPEETKSES